MSLRRADRRWGAPLALLTLAFGGACAALFLGAPTDSGVVAQATAQTPVDAAVDAAPPEKKNVTIVFVVVPAVKAQVKYGRRRLGFINGPRKRMRRPLIIQRPRDSGPLDVVVTADGFLDVYTRAYTFEDSKIIVKLTPEAEKSTLLGYQKALPDAGPDGAADGGVRSDGGQADAGVAPAPLLPAPLPAPLGPTPAPMPQPAPAPAPPPAPAPAP